MAAGKEIRGKIKSVENTKKITKAMEMVAASKMRKAQDRMRAARPYADKVRNVAANLGKANPEYTHAFMKTNDVKADGVIDREDDKLATSGEAPYPVRLADYFLRGWCPPGGTVCDPFTGTGTTPVAAHELGMNFIGCDIRQSQIGIANQRLALMGKEQIP